KNVFNKKRNLRRYILLTLARADANPQRAAIEKAKIVKHISEAIPACTTIVVAKEEHQEKGQHFHIGIQIGFEWNPG
uniref:hypothetical protein n=1 Tax=Paenibacillus sp. GbtcB18 TaxID=2824763 RepID=UPI001C2FCD72